MIAFKREEKPKLQSPYEKKGEFRSRSRGSYISNVGESHHFISPMSQIKNVRVPSSMAEIEKIKKLPKIHFPRHTSHLRCDSFADGVLHFKCKVKLEKESLERKVIQKKILLGSHLGHCRSKNLLHPVHFVKKRGEMQNSLAGVRGDLFLFRPLSSQRYIFKTLLFLLELLENGGRVLVVDTGDRSVSLFTKTAGVEPFLFEVEGEERKLVYNTSFEKGGGVTWKPPVASKMLQPIPLSVQLPRDFLPQKEFAWSGEKWFGGTLTNWEEISKKIYQFGTLLKEIPSDTVSLSSRFEKWMRGFPGFLSASVTSPMSQPNIEDVTLPLPAGVSSLGKLAAGVNGAWKLQKAGEMRREIRLRLGKKVDGILLINPKENRDVIAEARLRKIPVIGFADSSTNLSGVDLSIPINLSSIGETFLFLSILFEIGGRLRIRSKTGRGFATPTP